MGQKRPGYDRDYYLANRDSILARVKAYNDAHRDQKRASDRQYGLDHAETRDERVKAWNEANPEGRLEIARRWVAENPEKRREATRRYRRAHPDHARNDRRRRRVIKAGVLMTIRVQSETCALCDRPIDMTLPHPDPMSFTVGHEPPLAIVKRDGWKVVVERPEHFGCNLRKGTRQDGEAA